MCLGAAVRLECVLEVLATLTAALRLDPAIFQQPDSLTWQIAAWVALLAGLSSMLGHVAVLKINHIAGLRLLTSLLLNALLLVALYVIQAAMIWCIGSLVLMRAMPLSPLVEVALLALSPQVFAFITAMPHIGLSVGRLLEGWSYLIIWVGTLHVFDLGRWWALAITIAGWLVMQILSRLLAEPLNWVVGRLWTLASGRPTFVRSRDILAGTPMVPVGQHKEPAR